MLNVNAGKNKVLVSERDRSSQCYISQYGEEFEVVKEFRYLEVMISWDDDRKLRLRVGLSKGK